MNPHPMAAVCLEIHYTRYSNRQGPSSSPVYDLMRESQALLSPSHDTSLVL